MRLRTYKTSNSFEDCINEHWRRNANSRAALNTRDTPADNGYMLASHQLEENSNVLIVIAIIYCTIAIECWYTKTHACVTSLVANENKII